MHTPKARLAVLLSILPAPALGQPEPADPGPTIEQQIEDAERLVPRPPGDIEAFSPKKEASTSPVRPGLTGGDDWANMLEPTWPGPAGPALLPERSFVNNLRGTVLRGPQDTRIFVPTLTSDSDSGGGGEGGSGESTPPRAMLLLPCTVLDRFNSYILADDPNAPALLTGQVFLYNNRNYILPTTFRLAAGTPPTPAPPAIPDDDTETSEANTTDPTERPSTSTLADNPDVSALMAELERRSPIARPTTRSRPGASSTDADKPADITPVSDGQYITARRGRVIRTPEGTWSFVPDSDEANARVGRATNLTLLPCRTLEALENLALRQGDAAAGLMSGRLYQFEGHTYLLPTLYQLEHRGGVDPLQ